MTPYIERRAFVAALGAAALWRFVAYAQEPGSPVIGFLGSETAELFTARLGAFRDGLKEAGYAEGRNVAIQYRWAEGYNDRLSALAGDLVSRGVNVIAAGGTPAALAAKAASTTIPVVFTTATNPVTVGLARSLARPGGNSTGVTTFGGEIGPKQLELLQELSPVPRVVALLVNPTNPAMADIESRNLLTAAGMLGLQLRVLYASGERDFEVVFARVRELGAGALVIGNDLFFNSRLSQLAALTDRYGVPAIHQFREFAAAGGLMSYGGDVADTYRTLGHYAGGILKGGNAADLPIQQATKVQMVINLKAAAALGVTFPLALLSRADEVIE
jgi:putative tryptophan/tyrosine transport system substrate-binding protein